MVLATPIFLTFGSISIGIWITLRFSFFIPKGIDDEIFKALKNRISEPISLAALLFFIIGVVGLMISLPPEFMFYEVFFFILFGYVLIFFWIGLRRIDQIWPGRKLGTFTELLEVSKLRDYEKRMARKVYEAYTETDKSEERRKIAIYLSELLLK
jgi:hypothetical protein